MQMDALITVQTELFNYREVKPHFINPCCFGEDFASWLNERISPGEGSGFKISEIIQEDYGWGFWAREGKDSFWVAVSRIGNGPEDSDGEWGISISYDPGFDLFRRLFDKPDPDRFDRLQSQVLRVLESEKAIQRSAN
jgi:hypothetical protein